MFEIMPDNINKMTKYMPDRMSVSDRMPDKKSEYMPDGMS